MKRIHFLAGILLLLIGCSAPTSTYYVDGQLGNDTNPGTLGKPFKTIKWINSVQLHAGIQYFLPVGKLSRVFQLKGLKGTKEQPITIGSYGNGRAIINGENGEFNSSLRLFLASGKIT